MRATSLTAALAALLTALALMAPADAMPAARKAPGKNVATMVTPNRGAYYPNKAYKMERLYAGHANVARIFDGGELKTWSEYPGAVRAYNHGARIFSFSWAGVSHDKLRAFAASVPSNVTIYGTYRHEPEKDIKNGEITLRQWKTNFISQAAVMREVGIIPTRILMGWTLFPRKSGRKVGAYDLPAGTIDVAAFDAHVRDKDPVRMARKIAREQRRTGLPTAIPETSGKAANLQRFFSILQRRGVKAKFICYFSRTKITKNQSRVMFGVPK